MPASIDAFEGLDPAAVWRCFEALCRIPRPSGHPRPITDYVDAWAIDHGFSVRRDSYGNRVVVVPASPGRERAPVVVLQAHLDMVGEQHPGTDHDFARDPIRVERRDAAAEEADGTWLGARGTTLGADNGVGVALAQALATDPSVEHGPLELLFTLDEEIGLRGALALDPSIVRGRRLINLDSEIDGAIFVGCAGAAGIEGSIAFERAAPPPGARPWRVRVDGLLGGHSGLDIGRQRGHAITLLAQALLVADGADALAVIDGGDKGNAIPRHAVAVSWWTPERAACARTALATLRDEWAERFRRHDPGLVLELEEAPSDAPAPIETRAAGRLLDLLAALPSGVRSMSLDVPGQVQTSANLARVRTAEARVEWLVSMRSSSNAELAELVRGVSAVGRLAGAEIVHRPGYPGWSPDLESPLLTRAVEVHRRLFDAAPSIESIHAGLECGVLSDRLAGLDAISIGPEIRGAHSPEERVHVESTARIYRWTSAILGDLAAE